MACLCLGFFEFYMHTFHPVLVPDIQQGHLLILANASATYLQTVRTQLRMIEAQPHVVFMNIREFHYNQDHIFEVLVVLALP